MDPADVIEQVAGAVFGLICHQDPEILLQLGDGPLLICPRCFGLQVGCTLAYRMTRLMVRSSADLDGLRLRLVLLVALTPLALDWGLGGRLGWFASTWLSRLLTGLAAGSGCRVLLFVHRSELARQAPRKGAVRSGRRLLAAVLISMGGAAAVLSLRNATLANAVALAALATNVVLTLQTLILICRALLERKWRTLPQ